MLDDFALDNFVIDLQFFADEEKTEKATPKKKREAREKGQVLQSKEVNSALVLIFTFLGLKVFGKHMIDGIGKYGKHILSNYIYLDELYSIKNINLLFTEMIINTAKIIGPIIAITFMISLVSNYMQVGFLFTTKTLSVKFDKLNPIEGFKRIFSPKTLIELFKSIIKIFLLGYIIYLYAYNQIQDIFKLYSMSVSNIMLYVGNLTFGIAIRAGGVLIIIAIIDYIYQWWDYQKNLKMSKKEVKEEHKQTEGDPQIKSKIKEKQRQMAMSRMMQDVPDADVIITNPTHYAIAIKYDRNKFDAPYVVAKGKNLVAQKIKGIAEESSIPIVEKKPLARALYKLVEIGESIPQELYQAVAEVLAYVYSLNNKKGDIDEIW